MPRQVFTAGEILTAANLNDVSDQTVMVFDDDAARTTAIPTPVEGMVTYLKDTDEVEKFDGAAFVGVATPPAILQVVQTNKTDTFSTTSSSPVDITGASVTITPSSASSKVLVQFSGTFSASEPAFNAIYLVRNSTGIGGGTIVGSRRSAVMAFTGLGNSNRPRSVNGHAFLDSPNTTSAVTYKLQAQVDSGITLLVGRSLADADNATAENARTPLTITVMEVAG